MNNIATAYFLAKMIHTGKTTYDAVIKKYPNLKELIDTAIQKINYDSTKE